MSNKISIFSSNVHLAEACAIEIIERIKRSVSSGKTFSLVLPGGNTPAILFSILAGHYGTSVNWEKVHFFWGDERCVPADHQESNFRMAKLILIDKIDIPESNIHRIKGEEDPFSEAERYQNEIVENTRTENNWPVFDLIILGMGEDGHIASVFPENILLFNSDKICDVATHPVTHQKRVTLTGSVINKADSIFIMVTGKNKALIVSNVLDKNNLTNKYPVSRVNSRTGLVKWYLDSDAASLLIQD